MIFLVGLTARLSIPNLEVRSLDAISEVLPLEAMPLISHLLESIFQADPRLLSLGFLGAIWATASGFSAMMSALNQAYGVRETRPVWKRQLVAITLTVVVGAMVLLVVGMLLLGSRTEVWIAGQLGMGYVVPKTWPGIRAAATVLLAAASIEAVYFAAPNAKQRFVAQVPGALL